MEVNSATNVLKRKIRQVLAKLSLSMLGILAVILGGCGKATLQSGSNKFPADEPSALSKATNNIQSGRITMGLMSH